MSMVDNERIKLLANAFDRASTACFTVGIATPLAAFIYNVSSFRNSIGYGTMALAFAGWLVAAVGLHLMATSLEGASIMNGYAIFAFVVTPAIVLILGYIALRLHEWSLDRHRRAPGE